MTTTKAVTMMISSVYARLIQVWWLEYFASNFASMESMPKPILFFLLFKNAKLARIK